MVLLHCGDVTLHELLSALKTYVIMGDIVHDALMVIPVFLLITAGICFNYPTNLVEEVYFCRIYVGLASTLVSDINIRGILGSKMGLLRKIIK